MEVVANVRVEFTLNATDGFPKHRYGRQAKVELLKREWHQWVLQIDIKPRKVNIEVKTPAWLFANNVAAGKLTLKVGDASCPCLGVHKGTVQVLLSEGASHELSPLRDRLASILSGGKLTSFRPVLKDCTNALLIEDGSPGSRLRLKRHASGASTAPAGKKGTTLQPLSSEQAVALRYILEGKSVFLTGPAGTGKSLLLKRIIQELPSASTFFTASTALAACQLGGTTINAFAGIGRGEGPFQALLQKASRPENRRKWRACKVLIIDEVSMVDGVTFDLLEQLAREIRGVSLPFGNIQLVLVGDFHQLPPVQQKARKFCFESEAWSRCVHKCLELTQVHRQADPLFVRWLGSIRKGKASPEELDGLLNRCQRDLDESDGIVATKLQTHRADCEEQNKAQLDALPGESVSYVAQDDGLGALMEQLSVSCPAKSRLELKVGAQVMLIQTISAGQQLVNGARGVVRGFRGAQKMPVVRFSNGVEMMIGREKWSLSVGTAVATRKQVPLALAWAVSVHKSQGMTLDKVEVSLQKAFEYGMAYVALSRVRSMDGLKISGKIAPVSLQANPKVNHFYRTMCA